MYEKCFFCDLKQKFLDRHKKLGSTISSGGGGGWGWFWVLKMLYSTIFCFSVSVNEVL
jgi:hypothetical protein